MHIVSVKTFVYRFPLLSPVITSFGTMNNRPMLLVKITDKDGMTGWGEIWCNFPLTGAEHRAKLVDDVFSPLLEKKTIKTASETFEYLTQSSKILAIQSGEQGPFSQCIAGLDIAINDLIAKNENLPIWKKFGGKQNQVPIYTSGINPTNPVSIVESELKKGVSAFKLKIGFGLDKDIKNLKDIRQVISKNHLLMVDVNQGWNVSETIENCKYLEEFNLNWIEEPIPANSRMGDWTKVKENIKIPLAAGENFCERKVFDSFLNKNIFSILQPDLAKWGGFSKCVKLSKDIIFSNINYCPHFLGGGIGLIASAHLLSASCGNGLLEVDSNPNPLRSNLIGDLLSQKKGFATLSDKPGLGYEPNLEDIKSYLVAH